MCCQTGATHNRTRKPHVKLDLRDAPKSWSPQIFPSSLAIASQLPAMNAIPLDKASLQSDSDCR